jgi:hypothetical protein
MHDYALNYGNYVSRTGCYSRRCRLPPPPPYLLVSTASNALPAKWSCQSLFPCALGPHRRRLRPPEHLIAVEPLPRRPHFRPHRHRPPSVSFRHPRLARRHPLAALVAAVKSVFSSGHRQALSERATASPHARAPHGDHTTLGMGWSAGFSSLG